MGRSRKGKFEGQGGKAVEALRLAKNFSQEQFGDLVGRRKEYIQAIERGYAPLSIPLAKSICKALDIPVWRIIEIAEDNAPTDKELPDQVIEFARITTFLGDDAYNKLTGHAVTFLSQAAGIDTFSLSISSKITMETLQKIERGGSANTGELQRIAHSLQTPLWLLIVTADFLAATYHEEYQDIAILALSEIAKRVKLRNYHDNAQQLITGYIHA